MAEPTVTVTQLQLRLRTEIRDGGQTFTDAEVLECLQRAIDDEAVDSNIEIQIPLTGARQYAVDPSYVTIIEASCDSNGDGFPETDLPGNAYSLINGNLIIRPQWMNLQGTLFVIVNKKWTITDDIPSYLSNYIINAGVYYLTELLANTYESRFLNNDTTMSEILNRGSEAGREMNRLRKGLRNPIPVRL